MHRWHALDDKGDRVPLKYCRLKGRKGKPLCKQGFPKKVLRHKDGRLQAEKYRVRIVCQGVAGELNLKTSGRRNALGSIVGRRRCEYFASTSALLVAVSRSNSNVQCNYRVPITDFTRQAVRIGSMSSGFAWARAMPHCTASDEADGGLLRRIHQQEAENGPV